VLARWPRHVAPILADGVGERGGPLLRGRVVGGCAHDDTGVAVALAAGQSLRAAYLGGCDGGRSLVRKAAGIAFVGWDPATSHLIAEVALAAEPDWGRRRAARGLHSLSRMGAGGPVRRCDTLISFDDQNR